MQSTERLLQGLLDDVLKHQSSLASGETPCRGGGGEGVWREIRQSGRRRGDQEELNADTDAKIAKAIKLLHNV